MDTHELLERLAKLPRAQRLALTGLVYALVAVLFWVMLYSPAAEEVERLEAQQTELQVKRAKVRARAENREKFEAELQELTAALKKALRELPNDREIPELLKRISIAQCVVYDFYKQKDVQKRNRNRADDEFSDLCEVEWKEFCEGHVTLLPRLTERVRME